VRGRGEKAELGWLSDNSVDEGGGESGGEGELVIGGMLGRCGVDGDDKVFVVLLALLTVLLLLLLSLLMLLLLSLLLLLLLMLVTAVPWAGVVGRDPEPIPVCVSRGLGGLVETVRGETIPGTFPKTTFFFLLSVFFLS
jgi:hypothetical protein